MTHGRCSGGNEGKKVVKCGRIDESRNQEEGNDSTAKTLQQFPWEEEGDNPGKENLSFYNHKIVRSCRFLQP